MARLFRIVILLVADVRLIEYVLRLFQADAMFLLTLRLFSLSNSKRIVVYSCYIIARGNFDGGPNL